VRTTKYLTVLRKYYNKNVKERFFVVGDLVLKWKMNQDGMHKLLSPWEGPFEVIEVTWLLPTGWLISMALSCPTPGILISSGISTLEALKNKDMYPSCNLIISIKYLYFILIHSTCLSGDYFLSLFYNRPVDRPPFFLEFSEPVPSLTSPYTCMGPALYAPGGRRVLPGLTCVLLRVNRLRASHLDHISG
jgi:hypothetical protein